MMSAAVLAVGDLTIVYIVAFESADLLRRDGIGRRSEETGGNKSKRNANFRTSEESDDFELVTIFERPTLSCHAFKL